MSFLDTADACAIAEHVRKALLGPGQVSAVRRVQGRHVDE